MKWYRLGIDVKNLQGWRMNQKVKALNIVCHGSKSQLMLPFHQTETSETNLGEPFQQYLDSQGIEVKPIAAEAHWHWQLARAERHGGWLARYVEPLQSFHHPQKMNGRNVCYMLM